MTSCNIGVIRPHVFEPETDYQEEEEELQGLYKSMHQNVSFHLSEVKPHPRQPSGLAP